MEKVEVKTDVFLLLKKLNYYIGFIILKIKQGSDKT